jgi:hypothetical protein
VVEGTRLLNLRTRFSKVTTGYTVSKIKGFLPSRSCHVTTWELRVGTEWAVEGEPGREFWLPPGLRRFH